EDGIRDFHVTGVQTCALPIYEQIVSVQGEPFKAPELLLASQTIMPGQGNLSYLVYDVINQGQGTARDVQLELETGNRVILQSEEIGRASCRRRVQLKEVDRER